MQFHVMIIRFFLSHFMNAFIIKHKLFEIQTELQWIFPICRVHGSTLQRDLINILNLIQVLCFRTLSIVLSLSKNHPVYF
jgi:hypothetical protein